MVCDLEPEVCRFEEGLSPSSSFPSATFPLVVSPRLREGEPKGPSFMRGDVPNILDLEIGIPLGAFPPPIPVIRLEEDEAPTTEAT